MLENLDNCLLIGDWDFVTSILDRNKNALNRVDMGTLKTGGKFEQDFSLQDTFRLTNPTRHIYSYNS